MGSIYVATLTYTQVNQLYDELHISEVTHKPKSPADPRPLFTFHKIILSYYFITNVVSGK